MVGPVERKCEQSSKLERILLVTFYRLLRNTPRPLRPQTENYQFRCFLEFQNEQSLFGEAGNQRNSSSPTGTLFPISKQLTHCSVLFLASQQLISCGRFINPVCHNFWRPTSNRPRKLFYIKTILLSPNWILLLIFFHR